MAFYQTRIEPSPALLNIVCLITQLLFVIYLLGWLELFRRSRLSEINLQLI